jgi:hypothetical protein
MSWECPSKYIKEVEKVNEELLKLEGELTDAEARSSLAKFFRANLGLTVKLLTGIELFPYQIITLKALMVRDFSLCVWGRGGSKSFIAAIFCFLQCIFEPDTKIILAGPTFRTARNIFTEMEKMVNNPNAQLLQQCFSDKPSKRADLFEWVINGGSIRAIPLNGEKIRGFRANIIILDEFLLLSEDMVKTVLMPFLVAHRNVRERQQTKKREDIEIAAGRMKEEDRTVFASDTKMICLSSASYTFENLYQTYKEWSEKILDPKIDSHPTYFISHISYEVLPPELISETIIKEAQNGGNSHSSFLREYCARFTDGSDSYFSALKMEQSTFKPGQDPHLRLLGEKSKKYVLSIDPSFSNSKTSDNFAVGVLELNEEDKTCTLVHNYAVAGGDLKDHIKYFFYVYTAFNPVFIIIDNAGWQFIDSCNESEVFRSASINLKFFEFDSNKEGEEYMLELGNARKTYNIIERAICIKQFFTTETIMKMNQHLQSSIDYKKVWFASKLRPDDASSNFNKVVSQDIPIGLIGYETIGDLIDEQDTLIVQVKKECTLIEVSTNPKGAQTFDLPQHLKRSESKNRARKDSYTALLLGVWATKMYFDLISSPTRTVQTTFLPRFTRR